MSTPGGSPNYWRLPPKIASKSVQLYGTTTEVKFGVVGQPSPQVLVQALEIVKNDILKAIAKHEAEQEKQENDLPPEALQEIQENIEKA